MSTDTSATWARIAPLSGGAELYAYEATMPGLAEELALRGVLLGLLNLALARRFRLFGAAFGWGVVLQAVPFAALHATGGPVASTFAAALVFGWMGSE